MNINSVSTQRTFGAFSFCTSMFAAFEVAGYEFREGYCAGGELSDGVLF